VSRKFASAVMVVLPCTATSLLAHPHDDDGCVCYRIMGVSDYGRRRVCAAVQLVVHGIAMVPQPPDHRDGVSGAVAGASYTNGGVPVGFGD